MASQANPALKAIGNQETKFPLSKHHSLPELRSVKCPVHRGHCKFTNAATPGSISTDFTSREEKHASELSVLRVRHKSEPALVFLHLCVCHPEPTWTAKVYKMRLSVMGNEARRCTTAASFETAHGGRQMVVPGQDGGDNSNTSPKMNDVSTATPSAQPPCEEEREISAFGHSLQSTKDSSGVHPDPLSLSGVLSSDATTSRSHIAQRPSSVDRSHQRSSSVMAITKPSRNVKAFRRNLVVGFNSIDAKRPSLSNDYDDDDFHESQNNHSHQPQGDLGSKYLSSKSTTPVAARLPQLRSIRRKLSITRPRTSPEENSVKPIAISLTLSSAAAAAATPQLPTTPSRERPIAYVRNSSALESVASRSDWATGEPPAIPLVPDVEESTQNQVPPEHLPSESEPTSTSMAPTSYRPSTPVNVRLGHPSRPYYSAIRKNGISPPSSRPASINGYSSPTTRPNSYSPPSAVPVPKSAPGTTSQRHMSLSAIPPSAAHIFSAFALEDSGDSDDEVEDRAPIMTPMLAPRPSRSSLGTSLASVAKSLTRKRSASLGPVPTSFPNMNTHHRHSHSMTNPSLGVPLHFAQPQLPPPQGNVKGKGFRMSGPTSRNSLSGIGFSVSGETELKMALAFSESQAQGDQTQTQPPIGASSTAPPTPDTAIGHDIFGSPTTLPMPMSSPALLSSPQIPVDSSSRKSFASRVRKLRKGLKDMFLSGNANNTNSTTNASSFPPPPNH